MKLSLVFLFIFLLSGCGGKGSQGIIDSYFGSSSLPILTSVENRTVAQGDSLAIDINNIQTGIPGNDKDMRYSCFYDTAVDGVVSAEQSCGSIPNSLINFNSATGLLTWTPNESLLGNYELKVTGANKDGSAEEVFVVGVRLKFAGVQSYTNITGNSVQVNWVPHPQAHSYHVLKLDPLTGLYELIKTVNGSNISNTQITGLQPNTGYTFRVQAQDQLGNFDGNAQGKSVTTTELVRFDISASSTTAPSGVARIITIVAKNSDGSPQTVGGLSLAALIGSGTSTGSFSAVTDNQNGTYSCTFTPIVVGTPITVGLSSNVNFNIDTNLTLNVVPGSPAAAHSNLSVDSATISSGAAATFTAVIKDQNDNPISSGIAVSFSASGGTSTGLLGSVINAGNGVYNMVYTGVAAGSAQTVSLAVGGVSLSGLTRAVTVVPGAPVSANSTIAVSAGTVSSGDSVLVTAVLKDLNNNLVPSGISVTFNKSGGTSSGDFSPSVTNAGSGVYTTSYAGNTAGTAQTLTVSVNGAALTPSTTITVVAGAPSTAQSSLVVTSATVISGNFVTLTATLRDANSNPITSGAVTFAKTGGTSTGSLGSVTNQGNGVYNIKYTGVTAGSAQTLSVLLNGTTILGLSSAVQVLPGAPSASTSTLAVSSGNVTSGSSVTVTTVLRDDNNNPVVSGVTVGFLKSGGTSTGTFGSVTNAGGGTYTTTYSGVVAGAAQTLGVSIDGTALGPTASVAVIPGSPSALNSTFAISSGTVVAGSSVTLSAFVRDANNNPISSGILVSFDSVGGTSTGVLSATSGDGTGLYTATFTGVVSGSAKSLNTNINGAAFGNSLSLQVLTGPPSAATSTISVASPTVVSGNSVLITATLKDSQSNPINSGVIVSFSKSGGTSTGTFDTVQVSGSDGIYTVSYTGIAAGTAQTIGLKADGAALGVSTTIAVTTGAPVAANSIISVTAVTVAVNYSITVSSTIRDINNNPISSGITVGFTATGGTGVGTLGAVTNAGSGVYTASYTGVSKGSAQLLQATVAGSSFGPSVSVTVTAGAPHHLALVASPSNVKNLSCFGPYTLNLQDAANVSTSQSTDMVISFSSAGNVHSGTLFADAGCTAGISALTLPAYNETASFYFLSSAAVNFNLTASSSTAGVNSTSFNIFAQPILAWIGAGSVFTTNGSGSSVVGGDLSGQMMDPFDLFYNSTNTNLYVVDQTASRILRFDSNYNFTGWIGTISSLDGISCESGTPAVNSFTPSWCTGGRPSAQSTALLLNLRGITGDATYLYVTQGHSVMRFNMNTGQYGGWIGMNGASVNACGAANTVISNWCTALGTSNVNPSVASATLGGFSTPYFLRYLQVGGVDYLFIPDNGNHRIVRVKTDGTNPGWIGQVGATLPTTPASCNGLTQGSVTADWCTNGTSQVSVRYNLGGSPPTLPNEGFNTPLSLDFDGTYIYVADYNNTRIARWTLAGVFAGWIGSVTSNSTALIAPASSGGYTTGWSTGGSSYYSTSTTGFGNGYKIRVDANYIYLSDIYHRVIRVDIGTGLNEKWTGRISGTPTGGVPGCASGAVGTITPGWCVGGNAGKYGLNSGAFAEPRSLELIGTKILVADRYNYRLQVLDAATGAFERWIGNQRVSTTGWRTTSVGAARAGYDDSSFGFTTTSLGAGVTVDTLGNMYVADLGFNRIKRYNTATGIFQGYIGSFSNSSATSNYPYAPTAPEDCAGITSGMTPTWCLGGGRTYPANGVHGYNAPTGVASDGTSLYISNYNNHRIDKVRISDGYYVGWIGKVSTTPNDGPGTCTTAAVNSITPDWCIGGSATSGTEYGAIQNPRGLFYDSATSLLYVVENLGRLYKIDPVHGTVQGVVGSMASGSGGGCSVTASAANSWCTVSTGNSNSAAYGRLNGPQSVVTDANYIYVPDTSHRVTRFNKATGAPSGFIGALSSGTNTSTATGACNNAGWIAQAYPKVTPGWCYATSLGAAPSHALSALDGGLNDPRGVWVDATYLYVLDVGNHRISKYNAATGAFIGWKGRVATVPTGGGSGCTSTAVGGLTPDWCTGGSSSNSSLLGGFDTPMGLTGDSYYLYIFDERNNRIQAVPK